MLEINQRIELEVKSGAYEGLYSSRIEEINEDNLKVALPIEKGTPVPLNVRTLVAVNIIGQDAVYSGDTFIIGRERNPIPLLTLNYPIQFKRLQRRDYVRVSSNLAIELLSCEQNEVNIRTVTYDISGGGVRFVITSEQQKQFQIKPNSTLEINIIMEDDKRIGGLLQVIRMDEQSNTKNILVGGKFLAIEEREREQIIGYVFQRQRVLKKMGLL